MPINACSINTYSVDSICGTKRAKYIDILWQTDPVLETRGKGGWTGYYPEFKESDEKYENVFNNYEQPYISINFTMNGQSVMSSFENLPLQVRPLISINNLSSTPSEVKVDLHNLTIGKK